MQQKEISKADMRKKIEAWKTVNTVLVQANSEFMGKLQSILAEKQAVMEGLKTKLEEGKGTEEENAEYLFMGGYVQALKDILGKGNLGGQ